MFNTIERLEELIEKQGHQVRQRKQLAVNQTLEELTLLITPLDDELTSPNKTEILIFGVAHHLAVFFDTEEYPSEHKTYEITLVPLERLRQLQSVMHDCNETFLKSYWSLQEDKELIEAVSHLPHLSLKLTEKIFHEMSQGKKMSSVEYNHLTVVRKLLITVAADLVEMDKLTEDELKPLTDLADVLLEIA